MPSRGTLGQAGWIAQSFVAKFSGELTPEEMAIAKAPSTGEEEGFNIGASVWSVDGSGAPPPCA